MYNSEPVYKFLATKINAIHNCRESANSLWDELHTKDVYSLVSGSAPSGSGIDSGTTLELERSLKYKGQRIILSCGFHHMDDNGFYDGWTHHELVVKSSLIHGITLIITGPNKQQIKDYLHEVYYWWLKATVQWVQKKEDRPCTKEGKSKGYIMAAAREGFWIVYND